MRTAPHRRPAPALAVLALLAGSMLAAALAFAAPVNTDAAGAQPAQPFNNIQPSLALHFSYPLNGAWGSGLPVRIFAYSDSKMSQLNANGWVSPNGQLLSVNNNATLFSQLGTYYGGNGASTFAIPDFRGKTPIGEGQGPGLSNYPRGTNVGQISTTLTAAQLPAHAHPHAMAVTGVTGGAGSGQAVPNIQPSLAINCSITVQGVFASQGGGGLIATPNAPFLGEIMLHTATPGGTYTSFYQPANGTVIPVAQNTALFAILGTTYGGNGQTTFGKPDLRGTAAANRGQGPATSMRDLGEVFGSELVGLSAANLPLHSHAVSAAPQLGPTGLAGGNQPFSNAQHSLAVNYLIALEGDYPGAPGMSDSNGYIGEVILFAGNYTPVGYATCSGQLLPIAQNLALFGLLGTTFGGNGTTTFALPDLRGRIPVGASLSAGGTAAGTVLGSESVTLTVAQMPSHTHTLQPYCPADIGMQGGILGHDGFRDNNDFVVFINEFFMHHAVADFGKQGGLSGGDGLYDNNDFVSFIDAFFAPCPW
jgi:microcystin-dependent protein